MKITTLPLITIVLMILSCQDKMETNAQQIIDKSIEVSGGDLVISSNISFDFRDKHYVAERSRDGFLYQRKSIVHTDSITDVYTNKGFERFINKKPIAVVDSMKIKYSNSINSVHYFSVLPYGLNDGAVNKKYINKAKVKDAWYHTIEITFKQDGGGEDFEDVFIYWINCNTYKVDYLAYSYNEQDGKGLRFREAYNERYINGIRFVDYNNFKPIDANADLIKLDRLFENKGLKLLSKIELNNIKASIN
ncbi:DUF6503 family protein [uncultured Algibacter sp.]|uniref:DUF6503 family protein n=1 Tax=uncultured Algibacter sp. TaxID=298659 RepID=UPI003216C54A